MKKKQLFKVKLDVDHSNSNLQPSLLLKGFFDTWLHLSLLDSYNKVLKNTIN